MLTHMSGLAVKFVTQLESTDLKGWLVQEVMMEGL